MAARPSHEISRYHGSSDGDNELSDVSADFARARRCVMWTPQARKCEWMPSEVRTLSKDTHSKLLAGVKRRLGFDPGDDAVAIRILRLDDLWRRSKIIDPPASPIENDASQHHPPRSTRRRLSTSFSAFGEVAYPDRVKVTPAWRHTPRSARTSTGCGC